MQVVVYDDGSTDRSWGMLQSWKKKLGDSMSCQLLCWREAGQSGARGAGFARNRCIVAARGEWICLLDSDDVMEPDRVEKQLFAAESLTGTARADRYSVLSSTSPAVITPGKHAGVDSEPGVAFLTRQASAP